MRHKTTKAFFWKTKFCWIGGRSRGIRTKFRVFHLSLFNLLLLQRCSKGWQWQLRSIRSIFAGTDLPTPSWNQTPQLMMCINQHKQALQSCLSLSAKSLISGQCNSLPCTGRSACAVTWWTRLWNWYGLKLTPAPSSLATFVFTRLFLWLCPSNGHTNACAGTKKR